MEFFGERLLALPASQLQGSYLFIDNEAAKAPWSSLTATPSPSIESHALE